MSSMTRISFLISFVTANIIIILFLYGADTATEKLIQFANNNPDLNEPKLIKYVARSNQQPKHQQQQQTKTTEEELYILAYGDSLTAGMIRSGNRDYYPYAPFLQETIRKLRSNNNNNHNKDHNNVLVTVHHRGNPGWTATDMLNDLDGPTTGLRSALLQESDGTNNNRTKYAIVIILVGTNDLGRRHNIEQIIDEIQQLHEICFNYGVQRTVAIAVPPSGFQVQNEEFAKKVQQLNTNLQQYAERTTTLQNNVVTYYPFPFPFDSNDTKWSIDQLHLTPTGYQVLGENLAPVINAIIDTML